MYTVRIFNNILNYLFKNEALFYPYTIIYDGTGGLVMQNKPPKHFSLHNLK